MAGSEGDAAAVGTMEPTDADLIRARFGLAREGPDALTTKLRGVIAKNKTKALATFSR